MSPAWFYLVIYLLYYQQSVSFKLQPVLSPLTTTCNDTQSLELFINITKLKNIKRSFQRVPQLFKVWRTSSGAGPSSWLVVRTSRKGLNSWLGLDLKLFLLYSNQTDTGWNLLKLSSWILRLKVKLIRNIRCETSSLFYCKRNPVRCIELWPLKH